MGDILIRNVDAETKAYWKDRARKHGLSLSDQVKAYMLYVLVRDEGFVPSSEQAELIRRGGYRGG